MPIGAPFLTFGAWERSKPHRPAAGHFFNDPRVHFMRNALAYVPKTQETVVAAAIRQAFIQSDRETAGRSGGTSPISCGPGSRNAAG